MSRILRSLVCLLMICCILVNLSPLKAQATGAGAVAGGIVKAASVSIPGLWPIVACLAVVGITAYGIESGAFENIAHSCYSAFESAGTWINNGMSEILRTEDAEGNVQFYVDGGMLEDVRSWVYSSRTVYSSEFSPPDNFARADNFSVAYRLACDAPFACLNTWPSGSAVEWSLYISDSSFSYSVVDGVSALVTAGSLQRCYYASPNFTVSSNQFIKFGSDVTVHLFSGSLIDIYSDYDLTIGHIPAEDIELDDETIVTFHPYLADVIRTRTGGSGGSGEDDNKWWLAVAYAETLEKLYQTSQQAQIENPSVTEIPDIQIGIEYDVTEEEDEEGKKKYYLDPIQTPGTGTDPGTGDGTDTDPDTGTDSGNGSGDNTGTDSGSTGNTGSSWKPPSDHSQFALADLSKFFPFCIPFDLFDFFKLLNADPVAPSFIWEIQDLSGQTYGLTVDLSQWDSVAQLFRRLQLFLFVCGLAAASRKFIKW